MLEIKLEKHHKNTLLVLNRIPEFDGVFTSEYLTQRLDESAIILVAYVDDKVVACKIGYDRYCDGSFYSWLGGVLPEFRKQGIAQELNIRMEAFVKEKGYNSIVYKTRNKFTNMLRFGLKNGYKIIGFEEKEDISEHRIILKKSL